MKQYTVTAMATYFVDAEDATEALGIVYESMLGNDNSNILGCGEVHHSSMVVREGFHSTIKHGDE